MKYISKDGTKEVKVLEITKDGYVKFIINGSEIIVAKKRFDKLYIKGE